MAETHQQIVQRLIARWPEHRIAPGTERVEALCELLGSPQRSYPVIQIAGTNGKGSTAIMIDALLRSLGLRTGRFTSPHLIDVTERIAIDNKPRVWAQEVNFSYQTFGRSDWNQWQHFPELGASLIQVNFGEGAHGRGIGLLPNLAIPLFFRDDFDVHFRFGTGLGWVTKPFDYLKNPYQNAIGSHWNNITQFRFSAKWRPAERRYYLVGGWVFTHFSNGASHKPNFGLNLPAAYFGAQFTPVLMKKSQFFAAKSSKKPPVRRWGGLLQAGIAYSEIQVEDGPSYPIYSASAAVARYFSKSNRGFVGLDWEQHTGIAYFFAHANGVSNESQYRAVSTRWLGWVGDEFLFGPLGVHLQMGVSLSKKSKFVPWFLYNKLAFRYYLPSIAGSGISPWAGIYLKSHKATAEFISLSAGLSF